MDYREDEYFGRESVVMRSYRTLAAASRKEVVAKSSNARTSEASLRPIWKIALV